jgi:hypothetical protein
VSPLVFFQHLIALFSVHVTRLQLDVTHFVWPFLSLPGEGSKGGGGERKRGSQTKAATTTPLLQLPAYMTTTDAKESKRCVRRLLVSLFDISLRL